MRTRCRLLALLLCLLGLAIVPASAGAKANVSIAIADENASMFDSPVYQALHMKRTRYFIPWNAATDPQALGPALQFVTAARAHGVKVLMHISTDTFTHGVAALPSVAAYTKNVKALIKLFKPLGVKEWGVWNEENHVSEPTYRSPKRAAQFFVAMRKICTGCTIVALDLLDAKSATGYIKSFYKALTPSDRAKAKLVGIHNYEDVNHKRTSGTQGVITAVRAQNPRAQFWVTETGGIVSLPPKFPCDEARAAKSTAYMFTLAKKFSRYVKRLYYYSWSTASNCGGFDAGLTRANGAPRPAYATFAQALPGFTR
jgi:hypothetical protein